MEWRLWPVFFRLKPPLLFLLAKLSISVVKTRKRLTTLRTRGRMPRKSDENSRNFMSDRAPRMMGPGTAGRVGRPQVSARPGHRRVGEKWSKPVLCPPIRVMGPK